MRPLTTPGPEARTRRLRSSTRDHGPHELESPPYRASGPGLHPLRAGLALGLLASVVASAPIALAGEPDQQTEGTAPPQEVMASDPTQDADFDPGGQSTNLPFETPAATPGTAPASVEDDDTAPLDTEPANDQDAPAVDPSDQPVPGAQPTTQPVQPPSAEPVPAAPSPPPPPPAPAVTPAAPQAPASPAPDNEPRDARPQERRSHQESPSGAPPKPARTTVPRRRAPAPIVPARAPVSHDPVASAAATTQPPPATPSPRSVRVVRSTPGAHSRPRARRGARVHVVQAGESLWSIATDLLGSNAPAAVIARRVDQLWELNEARIATGDPDVLLTGTTLKLRVKRTEPNAQSPASA